MRKGEVMMLGICVATLAVSVKAIEPLFRRGEAKIFQLPQPSLISRSTLERQSDVLCPGSGSSTIVQALDYQCGPCHALEQDCAAFRSRHPEVRWLVIQFPLPMHRRAKELAIWAGLASKRGVFPEYHQAVMSTMIGEDTDLNALLSSHDKRLRALITDQQDTTSTEWSIDENMRLPINGTPCFYVFRGEGQDGMQCMSFDQVQTLLAAH